MSKTVVLLNIFEETVIHINLLYNYKYQINNSHLINLIYLFFFNLTDPKLINI